ncbi:hypothetical protein JTE90_011047 [Oedothorax gibbosus]|uniref:Cytochrome P450 n=1 Tax=Oedothorax gibbosus TaxID=931172 RepID=A0AAV6VEF3_9ARAC|nr:hypothetical protein JTE90_011047 [Oedothorax gibbosus]
MLDLGTIALACALVYYLIVIRNNGLGLRFDVMPWKRNIPRGLRRRIIRRRVLEWARHWAHVRQFIPEWLAIK